MGEHPLKGPLLKVERAYVIMEQVATEVFTFMSEVPLEICTDPYPDANGDRYIRFKMVGGLPDSIAILIAEQIYHLRSALDQVMVAFAVAAGADDTKSVYFPFAKSNDEYWSKNTQKKIALLAPDVQGMVNSFQPYKDGNDALWGIGQLSNVDKHSMLVPVGSSGSFRNFISRNVTYEGVRVGHIMEEGSLEEGVRFCNLGPTGKMILDPDHPIRFTAQGRIVFGDVDIFAGRPVVETLHELTDLVDGIVKRLQQHIV